MLKGRSVSTIGLGGIATVLASWVLVTGCGVPHSLGTVPQGEGGDEAGLGGRRATGGGGNPGGESAVAPNVGGGNPGGEPGFAPNVGGGNPGGEPGFAPNVGGSPGGRETTGGGGVTLVDRDYDLEGIGGHYTTEVQEAAPGKLDLLFVVDNSVSMADKQELLAEAVPAMVRRLVNPRCVDSAGQPVADQPQSGLDDCPARSSRELAPVTDLHVGAISSSLGGHGGILCSPGQGDSFDPTMDDRGQLYGPLRGLETFRDQGFLKWDPLGQYPGSEEWIEEDFSAVVSEMVSLAGERGCGYEATLESWYRFLVDPEPPADVVREADATVRLGTDDTVLAQRAAFLRPDSSLAIVLLSDENDCSVRDDGIGWLQTERTTRIPRGTAACADDPNDPCCRSCAINESAPPAGCVPLNRDPACQLAQYSAAEDSLNLRCWEQKRRFGIDFLYSTDRYVRALTHRTVFRDSDGEEVPNPIFTVGKRDPSMVTLVGIVGVPWQALARSTADGVPLRYKPAAQLHSEGAWSALVGNPGRHVPPTDPFMIESIAPRTGTSPLTGLSPEPVSAAGAASPINGHEYTIPQRDDLQYACTFPLATPRDCSVVDGGCDCRDQAGGGLDRPLCQAPGTTTFGTIQYQAKAYPGLRHLEVMRRIGDLAVPASICPRDIDPASPEFGYAPVVEAIIRRLRTTLE